MAICTLETGKMKPQYREGMIKVTTQLAGKDFATAAGLYNSRLWFLFFPLHILTFPPAPKIKLGHTEKAS